MVFIDYQNFYIALKNFSRMNGNKNYSVDFIKLADELNKETNLNSMLMKTYLFAYKPSDQLLELSNYKKYYDWLSNLKKNNYFEVIEGRQEVHRKNKDIGIDISDKKTYITVEKGTDINLAVTMLTKAYSNAYDIAILVSGDTDYIPVVEVLHQLGKIVVIAPIVIQNVSKYDTLKDAYIRIDDRILSNCDYKSQRETKSRSSQFKR